MQINTCRVVKAFTASFAMLLLVVNFGYAQETTPTRTTPVRSNSVRSNIVERVEQKMTEAKEKNAAAREEFKEKVAEIKDENKKAAVERINTALQTINTNKTTRWANALEKLNEILSRIKTKAGELETAGADVSTLNALINEAQINIDDASEAVENQAAKEYIIEIVDEQTLREAVQPIVQQFKEDLRATLGIVTVAKDSVKEAAAGLSTVQIPSSNPQQVLEMEPGSGDDILQ